MSRHWEQALAGVEAATLFCPFRQLKQSSAFDDHDGVTQPLPPRLSQHAPDGAGLACL